MKAVDKYSLPNKFRGHADKRRSHVWETELRRTISLRGGSGIHLYFALARTLTHDLVLTAQMAVPIPAAEYFFDPEISRILHNLFGGTIRSGNANENMARIRIFKDESIPKFLKRLERLRWEYDLSHPVQPLSDEQMFNLRFKTPYLDKSNRFSRYERFWVFIYCIKRYVWFVLVEFH